MNGEAISLQGHTAFDGIFFLVSTPEREYYYETLALVTRALLLERKKGHFNLPR